MKVLILGDTHRDLDWCLRVITLARSAGVQTVLQLGDFGYWPLDDYGRDFLKGIEAACSRHGLGWVWIKGNHEDHGSIERAMAVRDDEGFVPISDHIRLSPQGHRFELDGIRFGTLGGAVSVDAWLQTAGYRLKGRSYIEGWDWFPDDEAPCDEDLEQLGDAPLDVLLTHEVPTEIDMTAYKGFGGMTFPPHIQAATDDARRAVSTAMRATGPRLLVHGHWHVRHGGKAVELADQKSCRVEGLASNARRTGRDHRAYIIVDLERLDEMIDAF